MFKRFLDGLVWGSGFSMAVVAVVFLAISINTGLTDEEELAALVEARDRVYEDFSNLSVKERVSMSSVALIVNFSKDDSYKYRATVEEIIKVSPGMSFEYKIGDRYPEADYTSSTSKPYGEKALIMLVGPRARYRTSAYFDGETVGRDGVTIKSLRISKNS
jgi:hypothetical protein